MDKVYVVTNPEHGWDCVVGVFSDEKYVYERYHDDRYVIHSQTVDNSTYTEPTEDDLKKYGRSDYQYKVLNVDTISYANSTYINPYQKEVEYDGQKILVHNIIDPIEEEYFVEFDREEQSHTVDSFSVVADLFCEYTKIPKDAIRIYKEKAGGPLYLGSLVEYQDSKKLWQSFKEKNVEVYC